MFRSFGTTAPRYALGRLWATTGPRVPLEERWEAVEMCERLFRDTRIRVSTENMGLAKHPEGLELVRIGQPMRPEFAAWRYGDQFGRRRKRAIIYGVGGAAVIGGIVVGGAITGVGGGLVWQGFNFWNIWANGRTLAKLRTDDGRVIKVNNLDLLGTRLRPAQEGHGFSLEVRRKKKKRFEGAEAEHLLGQIIPKMDRNGGEKRTVQEAVSEIEHHGHPDEFLSDVVTGDRFQDKRGIPGYVNKMPKPTKLALEMALHEEQERRALEGELWRLERAWKEAEEIAAIADSLLLPTGTGDFIDKHREDGAAEEGQLTPPP